MSKIVSIDSKDENQLSCPASIPCEDLHLTYFLTQIASLLFTYAIIVLLEYC